MRRYDIVTFDCYGTLIDWERGIADAFRDAGHELDRDAVLRAYAEHEPIAEQPPFRPYRDVLADTARRVAHALGWQIDDTRFLAESLPSWTTFPDTNAALERLRGAGRPSSTRRSTDFCPISSEWLCVKRAPFAEMSQIDTAESPKWAESGGCSR